VNLARLRREGPLRIHTTNGPWTVAADYVHRGGLLSGPECLRNGTSWRSKKMLSSRGGARRCKPSENAEAAFLGVKPVIKSFIEKSPAWGGGTDNAVLSAIDVSFGEAMDFGDLHLRRRGERQGDRHPHPHPTILLLVAALLALAGCLAVPFEVRVKGDVATIDVSTLGEYPTSVSRIRLSEASHQTVVWALDLRVGDNPAALTRVFQGLRYRVVFPRGKSLFVLKRRALYRLEIWNSSGWRRSSQEFSFAG
jgi:hypothetical protein